MMGRTTRKRFKKKLGNVPEALDHENSTINLRKLMARNSFKDENKLKLRNFPGTGRGVAAEKTLHPNDVIITVPYNLMVTYATVQSLNFPQLFTPNSKLNMHDLLTVFLVLERHKKHSFWSSYIDSLPLEPPWIPSLLSVERVELLPLDLRLAVKQSRKLLEESWSRLRKSIKRDWTCSCCGKKADCVLNLNTFTWGYILVNTRAVYVNPEIIRELCDCSQDILSDEPCMALCPYLDMFNHSDMARTKAELTYLEGNLVYQLTTMTTTKKYEQVFISYGAHNNVKLLVEYGFFITGNCYDSIHFQNEDIFRDLNLSLSDLQYKFIRTHGLDNPSDLYVSQGGPSFNLKAFLFVVSSTSGIKKIASTVYSDCYPDFFLDKVKYFCHILLNVQLERIQEIINTYQDPELAFENESSLIIDFLRYRLEFLKTLCDNKR